MANDIGEKIKKIYALAMQGVGGEREAAQEILDKLLYKYEITLESIIDDDKVELREFTYHGKEQEKLLLQTIYKVMVKFPEIYEGYSGQRKSKTKLWIYCTAQQKAEIEFLYDFYVRMWEYEKSLFMSAFISKHEIIGNDDRINHKKVTDEEREKILQFMKGIADNEPRLAIE